MINKENFERYKEFMRKKYNIKSYQDYIKFFGKKCDNCGNDLCIFEIRQINNVKYDYFHKPTLILCNECITEGLREFFKKNQDHPEYINYHFVEYFNDLLEALKK